MRNIIYILIIVCSWYCNDSNKPKEMELARYPWIKSFTFGRVDFKGISHNLDLGTYSFSFKSSYTPIDTFFRTTDSSAINAKWDIIQKSTFSRKYKKTSTGDIVTLTFNSVDGRIYFAYSRSE